MMEKYKLPDLLNVNYYLHPMSKYLPEGLISTRFSFEKITENDKKHWLEFCSDANAIEFFEAAFGNDPIVFYDKWFQRTLERYDSNTGGLLWLIEKETRNYLGQAGFLIQNIDGVNMLEAGYSLIPRFWGKGYATEAHHCLIRHAFENNLSDNVISVIDIENVNSEKVAKRNGMKIFKRTNFDIKELNVSFPVNIYRITKEEFQRAKLA